MPRRFSSLRPMLSMFLAVAWRGYALKGTKAPDVAFELPTGTGKIAFGLLLAEWRRRAGEKTAYLTLNDQLASQVLAEAAKLGIPVDDLRGNKYSRSAAEEGAIPNRSCDCCVYLLPTRICSTRQSGNQRAQK
jgi:Rad3-related DNA helicase